MKIPFEVKINADQRNREVVCVSLVNRYRLTAVVPDAPEFPSADAAMEWMRAHGHGALVETLAADKDCDGFECWRTRDPRWLEEGDEQIRVIEEIDASVADWPSDDEVSARVSEILGRPVQMHFFDLGDNLFEAVYRGRARHAVGRSS